MILIKIISVIFGIIPDPVVMFLARLFHPIFYRALKKGKWGLKAARIIPRVFKDKDRNWHDRVISQNALHLAKFTGEIFQARFKTRKGGFKKIVIGNGKEYLETLIESGGGFIIVTCHLGNWEYGAAYIAGAYRNLYAPVFMINSKANRALNWMRSGWGVYLLGTRYDPRTSAMTFFKMRDLLNHGEIIFLVADQEALGGDLKGKLFGKKIKIFSGPFILGQKTKKPFLPMYTLRDERNRIVINFEEPFYMKEGNMDQDIDRIMNFFERHISVNPEQYIWSQERW